MGVVVDCLEDWWGIRLALVGDRLEIEGLCRLLRDLGTGGTWVGRGFRGWSGIGVGRGFVGGMDGGGGGWLGIVCGIGGD